MMEYATEQGEAALDEFGFEMVNQSEIGAPTPGRIADRLSNITCILADAIAAQDVQRQLQALAQLRRLRSALDAWDFGILQRNGTHDHH